MQASMREADRSSADVLTAIRRVVQAIRRSSRQAEHDHGLTGAQLFVLQKLVESDAPLTLGALAERTLTHPSSVSVVVSRLVDRGFVVRTTSTEDARRADVRLSAKGRTFLCKKAPKTAQEQLAEALERMPEERRTLLADLLTTLIIDAGFSGEDASMFFEDTPPNERKNEH